MRVHVRHLLPGIPAGVEHDTVPGVGDPAGHRCLVHLRQHFGEQPVPGLGQGGQIGIVILRDNQQVSRRLRADVTESYRAR